MHYWWRMNHRKQHPSIKVLDFYNLSSFSECVLIGMVLRTYRQWVSYKYTFWVLAHFHSSGKTVRDRAKVIMWSCRQAVPWLTVKISTLLVQWLRSCGSLSVRCVLIGTFTLLGSPNCLHFHIFLFIYLENLVSKMAL